VRFELPFAVFEAAGVVVGDTALPGEGFPARFRFDRAIEIVDRLVNVAGVEVCAAPLAVSIGIPRMEFDEPIVIP